MLAHLSRPAALLILAAFLAAAAWCFAGEAKKPPVAAAGQYTDLMLEHDIVSAMQRGAPYHAAAAGLHRAHGYPLKPFFTMRAPTLYVLAARLDWTGMQTIALALLLANIAAWTVALPGWLHPLERLGAVAGIAVGGAAVVSPDLLAMSEIWAGLLLGLALALRLKWREHWWLALIPAALALAVRELALPFVLLALTYALWERRWAELAGWAALLALFAIGMSFHAAAVGAEVQPGDLPSQGWTGLMGLRGFLKAVAYTSVWQQVPTALAMLGCLVPALGWLALGEERDPFPLLLLGGYGAMIALFARPDNFYWGFLVLPAWFAGYALAPRALWQLGRAISRR